MAITKESWLADGSKLAVQTIILQSSPVVCHKSNKNRTDLKSKSSSFWALTSWTMILKNIWLLWVISQRSPCSLSLFWWGQANDSTGVKGQRNISKEKYLKGIKKVTGTFSQNQIRWQTSLICQAMHHKSF